jgi:DNA-directed RNA polymerase subunit M
MKFCPKCDIRLKKSSSNSALSCPKCDYSEAQGSEIQNNTSEEEPNSDFLVLDENEGKDIMPTIEIECEKCGNNKAVWWMLQTRSADEPTTQFYRCTKCEHTWRNYA